MFDSFDDPVCCNYYDEKAQIVIATPIYIDEYINEINLKCVRVLIIDDIDKCFRFFKDFKPLFNMIMSKLTKGLLQLLVLSRSISKPVYQFINDYMDNANIII